MKINFDIECTPEEARQFLGLPDVQPMQEVIMDKIQKKVEDSISSLEPEALVKTWMPMTMQGFQGIGEIQKAFWSQMNMMNSTSTEKNPKETPKKKS